MGNVRETLSKRTVEGEGLYNEFIRIELCETIHFHYRDLRINLTGEQFKEAATASHVGYKKWNSLGNPYPSKEDVLLSLLKLSGNQVFKNELKIEFIEGGFIHIHYKDMRFEMQLYLFYLLTSMFAEARTAMEGLPVELPLDRIDPYDHCHFPEEENWFKDDFIVHERGIAYMMPRIQKGEEIVPIIVTPRSDGTFWRRDGYKRYMSYKRMGKTTIPCYIVSEETACKMPQNNTAAFKEDLK